MSRSNKRGLLSVALLGGVGAPVVFGSRTLVLILAAVLLICGIASIVLVVLQAGRR